MIFIDKENFIAYEDGVPLKNNQKVPIICEICSRIFYKAMKQEKRKKYPFKCQICTSNITFGLKYKFDDSDFIIDYENFKFIDKNGNESTIKQKVKIKCIKCEEYYLSSIIFEKKKKNPWFCKSCAIGKEWENDEYKEKHCEAIKKTANTEESKKIHSIISKNNWKNSEYRKKLSKNKSKFKHGWKELKNGNKIYLKSSYEIRFVEWLENQSFVWEYEKKAFEIKKLNNLYIPDFYIEDYDIWIEIKGYFPEEAKEKWFYFKKEYPHLKKSILFIDDIKFLENGGNFEDIINRKNRRKRKSL